MLYWNDIWRDGSAVRSSFFVKSLLCTPNVILRSRVLRVLCGLTSWRMYYTWYHGRWVGESLPWVILLARWCNRLSSCTRAFFKVNCVSSSHPECILVWIRRDFFLCTNGLAENARAWVSNIRWKSTSSGNAEPYALQKWKARTGGAKGRQHLWPQLVQSPEAGK